MKVSFFEAESGNFGDDLNGFLWHDLLPGHEAVAPEVTLLGVGTLLSAKQVPEGRILVIGSGTGYGSPPDVSDGGKWDIRAVRGPETARRLGLPAERGVIDPAALLPRLPRFSKITRSEEVLFVPHWQTLPSFDWSGVTAAAGIAYQAPSDPCETVIRRIAGARAVIAESMHAAIIADAFGVPWINVEIGDRFNAFKWGDWAGSLSLDLPEPHRFFRGVRYRAAAQRRLHRLLPRLVSPPGPVAADPDARGLEQRTARDMRRVAKGPFTLSDRAALNRRQDQLVGILEEIRRDYGIPEANG